MADETIEHKLGRGRVTLRMSHSARGLDAVLLAHAEGSVCHSSIYSWSEVADRCMLAGLAAEERECLRALLGAKPVLAEPARGGGMSLYFMLGPADAPVTVVFGACTRDAVPALDAMPDARLDARLSALEARVAALER